MPSYSWLYSLWGHFSIEQSGRTHSQYFIHKQFCLCICQQFATSFSCKTFVTYGVMLDLHSCPGQPWADTASHVASLWVHKVIASRNLITPQLPLLALRNEHILIVCLLFSTWSAPHTHQLCSLLAWHWHSMCHHILIDYCVYKLNVLCLEWRSWLSWLSLPCVWTIILPFSVLVLTL